ncbi:MAG: beta-lactamase family protein [Deltaproteobacteria bacterium]|nr:beta-lactamase family protein [Deltaproteobacteria bacterium]
MKEISAILEKGIAGRLFQAATFRVFDAEATRFETSAGECNISSIFDVASITKIFTALIFSRLRTDGVLSEETKLKDLGFLDAPPDKGEITLLSLLSHTSGLPDYLPLYQHFLPGEGKIALWERGKAAEKVAHEILAPPLAHRPDERIRYSDPGYILLACIIEQLSGSSLEELLEMHVTGPTGLSDTCYTPMARYHQCETGRFVSAGFCPLRGREMVGEVEDLNCYVLGGLSGHAGIFSTGYDLERLGRELFRCRAGTSSIIGSGELSFLLEEVRDGSGNRRRVGFDVPALQDSLAGRYFSDHSGGHLGFTGVSIWLDFARGTGMVFLANRVYYKGDMEQFNAVRRLVHDRAWEYLGL